MDNIFNSRHHWLKFQILVIVCFLFFLGEVQHSKVLAMDCTGGFPKVCTAISLEKTIWLPIEGGKVSMQGEITVISPLSLINDQIRVDIEYPPIPTHINLSSVLPKQPAKEDELYSCSANLNESLDIWAGFPDNSKITITICADAEGDDGGSNCLFRYIYLKRFGCGDGKLAPQEECEPATDDRPPLFHPGDSCKARGFAGGRLMCTEDCKVDTSKCQHAIEECEPDGCNQNCPSGCEEGEDPDCGCIDNNFCCGIDCDHTNDNDCPLVQSGIQEYKNPLSWKNLLEFIRYILKILFWIFF